MNFVQLKKMLNCDLLRYSGNGRFLKYKLLIFNPSFQITFWFRIGTWLQSKGGGWKILYYIVFFIHRHNQYKTGIQLPFGTTIGPGLCFSHFSCTVINVGAVIGNNFTMFQGCTVGSSRGIGIPVIGDNVVMSAGSKVIGNVKVGDNVMIGAGAVVVNDVPDNAVVVGVPAKIINFDGKKHVERYYKN